jgi:hypothetical protein
MSHPTVPAVQLRYTGTHGPLSRDDGKTQPIALDDIELLYGDFVLDEVMSAPGRWIDVTAPHETLVTALVNERLYTVHVVTANAIPSDFIVDTDARTITLTVNTPLYALVKALHAAKQHEPVVRTIPAPASSGATQRYRCWSRHNREIAVVILPGIGKREIKMESAAAHPALRDIFNKVRTAEDDAWKGGPHPQTPKAFVRLSDAELESLLDRDTPLPRLRRIQTRPVQLRIPSVVRGRPRSG